MSEFTNKVVVLTGGASGIGKCMSETFKALGASVYVIDIKDGDHFVGDISKKETLEAFSKYVIEKEGRVDVLINNALPIMKGISTCSYEEFEYALKVGVSAPFYLSKLFMEYFAPGASIINISSSRHLMSQEQSESYSAAKGGISSLTHALAMSLRGKVRVNSISPGWIDTTGSTFEGSDNLQHQVGRVGKPSDIAELAVYLASEKASFIDAQDFVVDGGMTKQMIYHNDYGWKLE